MAPIMAELPSDERGRKKALMIRAPVTAWQARSFFALSALLLWLAGAAFGGALPTPATRTEFDISHRGNTASINFIVRESRSYVFALQFEYAGQDDEKRVLHLVGGGTSTEEGIDVPIQLRLSRLTDSAGASSPIFDQPAVTRRHYAHLFGGGKYKGAFNRKIFAIDLDPGKYSVQTKALADNPVFAGAPIFLVVEYHANIRFLPDSIKIPHYE